jgi:tRNA pseudouridine38-40 synthase
MSMASGPTSNAPGLRNSGMRNFAVTLSYNGTRYGGWQIQNNATSIQQKLQEAIAEATSEHVVVRGSGRTDSGVHALGQVATFRLETWRAPADRLVPAINRYLPRSIVVKRCREAVLEFDPTRDAHSKRYRYTVRNARVPDALQYPFQWWYPRPLEVEPMRQAASLLVGTHDFKAFETLGSPRKTSVRTIYDLKVLSFEHDDGQDIWIEIEADGFLYNMVRNIAGALCEIGVGRFGHRWIQAVLESKVRDSSSQTAPPQGLCLVKVNYPDTLFLSQ